MATSQNFKATKDESPKALPIGTTGFTKNSDGKAWLLTGTNAADVDGAIIEYKGVPYTHLDPAVQYYIRVVDATFAADIVL